MEAGKLRDWIHIERRSSSTQLGHPVDVWESLDSVWADIRSTSGLGSIGNQFVSGHQEVSRSQYSIRIYQRLDVTAAMRVIDGNGVIYDIREVLHDVKGGVYTDLVCSTGASDGD